MKTPRSRAFAAVASLVLLSTPGLTYAQSAAAPALSPTQQRAATAANVVRYLEAGLQSGHVAAADLAVWYQRLYEARRDAGATGAALVAAAQEWVTRTRSLEQSVQVRVNAAASPTSDLLAMTYFRLTAEIELARVNALVAPHR